MTQAGSLNSVSDFRKTLIVIMMYVVLWSSSLAAIFVCVFFQRRSRQNELKFTSMVAGKNSPEDLRVFLTSYINAILPAVYQNSSGVRRLFSEILRNHRYIMVFSSGGAISDEKRMLVGAQLLTVQSMLMFMLSVLYRIQVQFQFFFHDHSTTVSSFAHSSHLSLYSSLLHPTVNP
jgi:hypothetical protein